MLYKTALNNETKIFQFQIYNNFRNENPKIFEKVTVIAGDISAEGLDLSEKDRQKLIDEVNVVFHIAAVLNMDADLKSAVNTNCTGTLRLLHLCTEMKNLKVRTSWFMLFVWL